MKKKELCLILAAAPLISLTACNSLSEDSNSSIDREKSEMSQTMLDALKSGSISFEGERKTTYMATSGVVEEGNEKVFIGKSSFSFYEYSLTSEETITDVTYFKNDEGKATSKEIEFNNTVTTIPLDGGKIDFDENFYNPFSILELEDFVKGKQGIYNLNEEKEDAFWKPLAFYSETLLTINLQPYSNGTIDLSVTSRSDDGTYRLSIDGTISLSKQTDLDDVTPYKAESYHANLQSAYDAMCAAKNFTYHRTRMPIDENVDVDAESYDVKISSSNPKAVLFVYNGVDTKGIARFGDDSDYTFTVADDKVVRGDSSALHLPFAISTVKAEVFEKVDDTHFKARSASLAKQVAGFLMEKTEEALLVDGSLFGDAGCDSLVLETDGEKTLTGFAYVVTRSDENGRSYREKNEVKISNINDTSIAYDFSEGKKVEPTFDITPFIGEFEGYNTGNADNDLHSLKINGIEDMALDGTALTFHSRVHDESFNAVWGTNRYVQISYSSWFGYTVKEAKDSNFSSFSMSVFFLNLAKKEEATVTWKDIILSNGWRFEDEDECEYTIKPSSNEGTIAFYKEERVDGSWADVEKDASNISFADGELKFTAIDKNFVAKFYSKTQGIIKTDDNSIKGFLSPKSDY